MTCWQIDTAVDHDGRHWCCIADPDDDRWMIQSMDHLSSGEIVRVFDSAIAAWQRVPQVVLLDNARGLSVAAQYLRAQHDVEVRHPRPGSLSRVMRAEQTLRTFIESLKTLR